MDSLDLKNGEQEAAAVTPNEMNDYRSIWTYFGTVSHALSWIDVEGVKTRYLRAGDPSKPTVILLHGTAGSLENFAPNYGALGQEFDVIGIDMLGCGYTDKPDFPYQIADYAEHVIRFMDALGIEEAALVGVSLGSWVAAKVALVAPSRVTGLGLLAPAGIIVDPEREKKFAQGVREKRSRAAGEPTWENVTRALRGLVLNERDLLDDVVATRLNIYKQPAMQAAMGNLLAFTRGGQHLSDQEWASIEVPALVVASVDAPNMFLENARRIAQVMPQATLWDLQGCDHWPQFERPDEVNAMLVEVLRSWTLKA